MTARDQIRAMLDQLMGSDNGRLIQIFNYIHNQLDRAFYVKQIEAPCFSTSKAQRIHRDYLFCLTLNKFVSVICFFLSSRLNI